MALLAQVTPSGAPDPSFPAPASVVVEEAVNQPTRFALKYSFGVEDSDYALLKEAALDADQPIVIQVEQDEIFETLIKGSVLRHNVQLNVGSEGSLEVLGADDSTLMNFEHKNKVWVDVTDDQVVQALCATYGFIPDTESTPTVHSDTTHALVQRETDLALIRRLARWNGYWFWLSCDPIAATTTAHFKKPPVDGEAAITLSVRPGEANIESVSLQWDLDRPSAVNAKQFDLSSLSVNDGSAPASTLTGLASQALSDIVQKPRITELAVPVSDAADLKARGEALLIEAGWFVAAQLVVKKSVLNQVVRAHSLVALDGAGTRHSGNYLVSRVVHEIDAHDHVMTVELMRNGWN